MTHQAWARGHGLNEARLGSLSSYAYSLLCIGYMQAIGAFSNECMHIRMIVDTLPFFSLSLFLSIWWSRRPPLNPNPNT